MERFREHEKEFKTKQYSQKALMARNSRGGGDGEYDSYGDNDDENDEQHQSYMS